MALHDMHIDHMA